MPPAKKNQKPQASKKGQSNGTDINKMDAMRHALSDLGNDAMPLQIKDYLKSKFGIDTDTTLISTYKSTLLRKGKGKQKAIRQPSMRTGASSNGGVTVKDIKAIKELSDRIGAETVRELAAVLSE